MTMNLQLKAKFSLKILCIDLYGKDDKFQAFFRLVVKIQIVVINTPTTIQLKNSALIETEDSGLKRMRANFA
jgi:hypothetical protein